MAGQDRRIDPVTRDYIRDGNGGFEKTTTIEPAVYHRLAGKRNAWWGDGEQGSDVHLFRSKAGGVDVKSFAFLRNAIQTALAFFTRSGRAADLYVTARSQPGKVDRVEVESEMRDTQGGQIPVADLANLRGRD